MARRIVREYRERTRRELPPRLLVAWLLGQYAVDNLTAIVLANVIDGFYNEATTHVSLPEQFPEELRLLFVNEEAPRG